MSAPETIEQYTAVAKMLHWLVAGGIVLQFILAQLAENAEHSGSSLRELALLANHKSVGITILGLAAVRLLWRLRYTPPALPAGMPRWQTNASHISHWTLYALLFAMPVSGWLMSSASAYSVSWFNLFPLPDLVGPDPELKDVFEEVHEFLAVVLLVIAGLHVLGAFKHAVIDKDGVMQRMISAFSLAAFVAVIVAGAASLGRPGSDANAASPSAAAAPGSQAAPAAGPTGDESLPLWDIDYAGSFVKFTGDQAGAEFDGVWASWQAEIRFAADRLGSSVFDVTIDTTSAETRDNDRDAALQDPEWFDTKNYPEAYYRATSFSANEDGSFTANGELAVKGSAAPVELRFTVTREDERRVLVGEAELLRLEHDLGTGDWTDTTWVGNEVYVEVRVEATVSD